MQIACPLSTYSDLEKVKKKFCKWVFLGWGTPAKKSISLNHNNTAFFWKSYKILPNVVNYVENFLLSQNSHKIINLPDIKWKLLFFLVIFTAKCQQSQEFPKISWNLQEKRKKIPFVLSCLCWQFFVEFKNVN